MFYNLEGQPTVTGDSVFTDVTREQFAVMLYKYAWYKGIDTNATRAGDLTQFTDSYLVDGWALDAVEWDVGAELINGNDDHTVAPLGSTIRAHVASIMAQLRPEYCKQVNLLHIQKKAPSLGAFSHTYSMAHIHGGFSLKAMSPIPKSGALTRRFWTTAFEPGGVM